MPKGTPFLAALFLTKAYYYSSLDSACAERCEGSPGGQSEVIKKLYRPRPSYVVIFGKEKAVVRTHCLGLLLVAELIDAFRTMNAANEGAGSLRFQNTKSFYSIFRQKLPRDIVTVSYNTQNQISTVARYSHFDYPNP